MTQIENLTDEQANALVRQQLYGLFGNPEERRLKEQGLYQPSPRSGGRGSLTHDLAAFQLNAATYWGRLTSELKEDIKTQFEVDESTEPVRITLG